MHIQSEPEILYFGTPVILISTCNEDESYNIAPISSVFWLGWRCIIGISAFSKTTENIKRTGTCVINMPSVDQAGAVNRLALTTGSSTIPEGKIRKGYRYISDKFKLAGLNPIPSETILPPRIDECPVQMETSLAAVHGIASEDAQQKGKILTMELRVLRVHLEESILLRGTTNRVDPDKWKPLIMSFQKFYGLTAQVHESLLATIPEILYHNPDMDNARKEFEKMEILN